MMVEPLLLHMLKQEWSKGAKLYLSNLIFYDLSNEMNGKFIQMYLKLIKQFLNEYSYFVHESKILRIVNGDIERSKEEAIKSMVKMIHNMIPQQYIIDNLSSQYDSPSSADSVETENTTVTSSGDNKDCEQESKVDTIGNYNEIETDNSTEKKDVSEKKNVSKQEQFFSYDDLINNRVPTEIPFHSKEQYLSDSDFQTYFNLQ